MSTLKKLSSSVFELIMLILFLNNPFKTFTFAQSSEYLDSLYQLFVAIKSNNVSDSGKFKSPNKCGMDIINQIKINYDHFNMEQKEKIQTLLSRPVLQTSIVSPSGFFRVHYDTTGVNTPAYLSGWSVDQNVAEVGNALDSVYRFEVNYFEFLPPPGDNSAGGDDKYDIYIQNLGGGIYGYTEWESKVGVTNWTSFAVIDNDYTGYFSVGLDGMRVTVAHEFHHGIQLGNYAVLNSNLPYRSTDIFFYELTSTSMEEFVYDDVNDYYAYMTSYFQHPEIPMPKQNGYNLAIWNIFINDNYGYLVFKRQWELIPSISAILAIDQSLNEVNTFFPNELNKFGVWTYFTNFRAMPGTFFEEASNYPLITISLTTQFTSPSITINLTNKPTSNKFMKINLPTVGDYFIAVITNADATAANENPDQLFPFTYLLYDYHEVGSIPLMNNYYYNFSVSSPEYWKIEHIFNDIVNVEEGVLSGSYYLYQNYPNPFNPTTSIQFAISSRQFVTLKVYDLLGRKVETLVNEEKPAGTYEVEFNAESFSSGIYFYELKAGSFTETKKMVLLR